MSKANDGGPAFPVSNESVAHDENGMSLRDWFAGQALAGLAGRLFSPTEWDGECIAPAAYELADAMLAEREKGGSK